MSAIGRLASIEDDAVTGINTVDNTEQVYLSDPVAGDYVVTVDYAGRLTNGLQDYSLIVTGQTAAEIEVVHQGPPVLTLVDNVGPPKLWCQRALCGISGARVHGTERGRESSYEFGTLFEWSQSKTVSR